ncbi:MAG: DegT/DnrJ/EryC1/StrS family aminotransferase [Lentisphaeraceae bacterium]|nr:DegT/DnrJ/EryC1/StrS family aminotransferase [Lentisphaeraceae bacterium]
MKSKYIQIATPSTGLEEWNAVKGPIESGWLTQGPKVAQFEKDFAEFHKAKLGIATTSCTTGLHLILTALGIGPEDEVIVPAFTWVATANVVRYCGAKPVFCDIDLNNFNLDPDKLKSLVTSKTKAVIAVHLFGYCADIKQIKLAIPSEVHIIEDAACAAGAIYDNRYAGTLGIAASFSFHPRKSITTGEGGMITTNDSELADKINQLRNHGATISEEQRHQGSKPYLLPDFNLLGFNYRMTDLQGAIGLTQLKKLEQFIQGRAKIAKLYTKELQQLDWLQCPEEPKTGRHAWQSYVTYVNPNMAPKSRNEIMQCLQDKGIATRPGTHALHTLNLYKDLYGFTPEDFPNAHAAEQNSMAIPLHNQLTPEDCDHIISTLKSL